MDYYLYSHSNTDGIFYIGKGCKGRADKWSRTKEWKEIAQNGYTTKIEANGTEKDILSLEKIVIKSLVEQGVKLVNKVYNKNIGYNRGSNNSFFGKKHTLETREKMSGKNNYAFGRFGKDHPCSKVDKDGSKNPMFGKDNKAACTFAANRMWQKRRFNKANNYRRQK